MADPEAPALPSLAEMQHWTLVLGRMQQTMMEHGLALGGTTAAPAMPQLAGLLDPAAMTRAQDYWQDGIRLWQRFLDPAAGEPLKTKDKRLAAAQWQDHPLFDLIRQSYLLVAEHLLKGVESLAGIEPRQKEQLRFVAQNFVDAMSPANFALTNPLVLEKTIETRGENLLKGMQNLLADMAKGQLTHTDSSAFEVGRNIAVTPGKVVKRTPLYELIQYAPTSGTVLSTPLIIFPPWINRFYILDLSPEKSFIRWAVEQGLTVFMVSWRSADASMKDVVWDDYVERGQIDAIDTVRALLDVESVHAIGYCVAGTTLAATLAVLAARDQAAKVASATFFTAQVDFTQAGELGLLVGDEQMRLIEALSGDGFLDGRYMAATFNMLRGRDLIWNYVTNHYLLGQEYPMFDLLHWNGDTTNLPSKWHKSYLTDLYRDNRLVEPGALKIGDTPLDLRTVATPTYVQAGREDHIAPAESVWKITDHFTGPVKFVLAGSGHIAGVVNPPKAEKYQYWTNDAPVTSLAEFVEGAHETKGSWWPDWIGWIRERAPAEVAAAGARIPGEGALAAIEAAPGSYVKAR